MVLTPKFVLAVFSFMSFISLACSPGQSVSIDSNGYLGCYKWSIYHQFNAFASHLNPNQLTPHACLVACSAVKYNLAGIQDGQWCFCQSSMSIQLLKVADTYCQYVSCLGDSTIYCGQIGYWMVYQSDLITLKELSIQQTDALPLYSSITVKYNYTGQPTCAYLREDQFETRNDLQTNTSNSGNFTHQLITTGVKTYELIISASSPDSFESSRKAVSTPLTYDPISSMSMQCPSLITDQVYLRCNVTFAHGSNLQATISSGNSGSSPTENFTLSDFNTITYGLPVPKTIQNYVPANLPITNTCRYVAANAEILQDGYLVAIEIYAETNGSVTIHIGSKIPVSAGDIFKNMDYSEASNSLSTNYTCGVGGVFLRSAGNCNNVNKSARFNNYTSSNSFAVNYTASLSSVTLTQGYNIISASQFGTNVQVSAGQLVFIVFSSGRVGVDTSGNSVLSDFIYNSSTQNLIPLNASQNWRMYVSVIVSPMKKLSIFESYPVVGTYTVTANLTNIANAQSTQSVSQTVTVEEAIQNLQITTQNGLVCYTTIPCNFGATFTGSNLIFVWTIQGNGTTNTTVTTQTSPSQTSTSISQTFVSGGFYSVSLYAYNNVSSQTVNVTVQAFVIIVNVNLTGLSFKSGSFVNSTSIVGQYAQFLFILQAGQNYSCLVDFGDGSSKQTVTDYVSSPNNTYVPHLYSQQNIYVVSVNCVGPLNSLFISFGHIVEYPLVGLQLTKNGTTLGTAYTVGFSLQSGSAPTQFGFYFDNVLDTNAKYSNLLGQSATHNPEYTPTIHYIYIYMSNYVSSIQLNTTFEISTSLVNPKFNVSAATQISPYTYYYNTTLNFWVTMSSGSNVNISLNFDSLNQPSTLTNTTLDVLMSGYWPPVYTYTIPYIYSNPGHFTVLANVSNSMAFYTFMQPVVIMTKVDYLIPQIINNNNNYVVMDLTTGLALAQFAFSYYGTTKAGSDAYVTFWPGDTANNTFGPYPLNMDYNANMSRAALQYSYSKTGTYSVAFFVSNSLGSKWFSLTVQVVVGMSGFYIAVSPLNAPIGANITVSAFLVQGFNVTYNWICNGTNDPNCNGNFGSGPKTSTLYSVPDNRYKVLNMPGNYTFTVQASDMFSTLTKSYTLELQIPITALNAIVSPSTPQTNIDTVPSTRTFTFSITLSSSPYGPSPTDAYYVIDFGDGSPVNLPTYYVGPTQITYTYQSCNIYTVNVTAFNQVSSFTKILNAEIFSNFIGLTCQPYWRQYPSDTSPDIAYKIINGSYYVYKEYPIRFYCTWLRLDAIPTQFNLLFDGSLVDTITNITSLTKINQTSSIGYIVPYSSSYFYNYTSGIVGVTSINPSYTVPYSTSIVVISAIVDINWVLQTNALVASSPQTYQIAYGSLGEPSCSLISFMSGFNTTTIVGLTGTSSNVCASMYPSCKAASCPYLGDYSNMTSGGVLTFVTAKVNVVGNNQLVVNVTNAQGSIVATTNVTMVLQTGLCNIPQVDIYNKSTLFYSPVVFTRSELIVISSQTVLNCSSGLGNNKQWFESFYISNINLRIRFLIGAGNR